MDNPKELDDSILGWKACEISGAIVNGRQKEIWQSVREIEMKIEKGWERELEHSSHYTPLSFYQCRCFLPLKECPLTEEPSSRRAQLGE